jgi:hypothetical protein
VAKDPNFHEMELIMEQSIVYLQSIIGILRMYRIVHPMNLGLGDSGLDLSQQRCQILKSIIG